MTCQAALSREEYPPALPQLVAIDDCALSARHVVEDAALDKRVLRFPMRNLFLEFLRPTDPKVPRAQVLGGLFTGKTGVVLGEIESPQ